MSIHEWLTRVLPWGKHGPDYVSEVYVVCDTKREPMVACMDDGTVRDFIAGLDKPPQIYKVPLR